MSYRATTHYLREQRRGNNMFPQLSKLAHFFKEFTPEFYEQATEYLYLADHNLVRESR